MLETEHTQHSTHFDDETKKVAPAFNQNKHDPHEGYSHGHHQHLHSLQEKVERYVELVGDKFKFFHNDVLVFVKRGQIHEILPTDKTARSSRSRPKSMSRSARHCGCGARIPRTEECPFCSPHAEDEDIWMREEKQ